MTLSIVNSGRLCWKSPQPCRRTQKCRNSFGKPVRAEFNFKKPDRLKCNSAKRAMKYRFRTFSTQSGGSRHLLYPLTTRCPDRGSWHLLRWTSTTEKCTDRAWQQVMRSIWLNIFRKDNVSSVLNARHVMLRLLLSNTAIPRFCAWEKHNVKPARTWSCIVAPLKGRL